MKNSMISIIVPVYNVPHHMLTKCLDSLKLQTYKNIEVIVIDDGSTDKECSKICDNYKNDKRFSIFHKKNGGLCNARNYGFKHAKGRWITFVDGDDSLTSNCLELVIKSITKESIDIICFGTTKEYNNHCFNYDYGNMIKDNFIYRDNAELLSLLLDFNSNIGDVTAKLYKKSFLQSYELLHNEYIKQGVEAIDFNFRCFEKCNGFQFCKIYGYNYSFNPNSITMTMNNNSMHLLLKGIDELYNDLEKSKYRKKLFASLDKRINFVLVTTVISGIFSPLNRLNKKEKKILLQLILNNKNVKNAINNNKIKIDIKRRIILYLIKNNNYYFLTVISLLRTIQKQYL